MIAKVMSVYRGEESLAESFWLWLFSPLVLIFGLVDRIWSHSIAIWNFNPSTFSMSLSILRVLLLALLFFFGIGVVRSARAAKSRVLAMLATAAVVLLCAAASALVLSDKFRSDSPSEREINFVVRNLNTQFPQPLAPLGTWERLAYSNQVLSARFELDRSVADRIAWDRVRSAFVTFACKLWTNKFEDSPLRKFEGDFYSGTTLFQTMSVTRAECR